MLVMGTEIQLQKSGSTSLIEEMRPGCSVYNPVSDSHGVVVELLKRQVIPTAPSEPDHESHLPVRIRADALGAGKPIKDLLISQAQVLLVGLPSRAHRQLEECSARHLCNGVEIKRERSRIGLPITYYVPLFDRSIVFRANGLLLLGLPYSDFKQGRKVSEVYR